VFVSEIETASPGFTPAAFRLLVTCCTCFRNCCRLMRGPPPAQKTAGALSHPASASTRVLGPGIARSLYQIQPTHISTDLVRSSRKMQVHNTYT
jgi:hypothetical protein